MPVRLSGLLVSARKALRDQCGSALAVFLGGLCAIVAVCLIFALVCALSVRDVRNKAHEIEAGVSRVAESAQDKDREALLAEVDTLSVRIDELNESLHGPLWDFMVLLPIVGQDVSNGRTIAEVAKQLCDEALGPTVRAMSEIDTRGLIQGDRINVGALEELGRVLTVFELAVDSGADKLESLAPGSVGQMNELMDRLKGSLRKADDILLSLVPLMESAPDLLGAGGQEAVYVLLAQNNSELRAGGGLIGAVGTIRIRDGHMELGDFTSVYNYLHVVYDHGFEATIADDERETFGPEFATDLSSTTQTPDFVRAGEVTRQLMENALGEPVYGVVALDPIFLQRVLSVIGGVTAEDGTVVDGTNAAYELLSNVYWRYGYEENFNELEDAFFADVARKSFDKLLGSVGGMGAEQLAELWSAIERSGEDHHFQVWVSDPEIEEVLSEARLSGGMRNDPDRPEIGIYTNDKSISKLCWYLSVDSEVTPLGVSTDDCSTYEVVARFTNSFSEEEAQTSPDYIGALTQSLKRGHSDMVQTLLVVAPTGAEITDFEVVRDSKGPADYPVDRLVLYGRDTMRTDVNIFGGESVTVKFSLQLPPGVSEVPVVRTSPLCRE